MPSFLQKGLSLKVDNCKTFFFHRGTLSTWLLIPFFAETKWKLKWKSRLIHDYHLFQSGNLLKVPLSKKNRPEYLKNATRAGMIVLPWKYACSSQQFSTWLTEKENIQTKTNSPLFTFKLKFQQYQQMHSLCLFRIVWANFWEELSLSATNKIFFIAYIQDLQLYPDYFRNRKPSPTCRLMKYSLSDFLWLLIHGRFRPRLCFFFFFCFQFLNTTTQNHF